MICQTQKSDAFPSQLLAGSVGDLAVAVAGRKTCRDPRQFELSLMHCFAWDRPSEWSVGSIENRNEVSE